MTFKKGDVIYNKKKKLRFVLDNITDVAILIAFIDSDYNTPPSVRPANWYTFCTNIFQEQHEI